MRAFGVAGATAAVLTTTLLFVGPANADRVCREVCNAGICKSRCVERGDRLYMHEERWRGRDHDRSGVELRGRRGMHRPGVDIEINR
jgi:hypothetical protein